MAFQELKKHVSVKLGIPNSVMAAKIGGAALRVAKENFPEIANDGVAASKKAIEEFDNNINKYKKMIV